MSLIAALALAATALTHASTFRTNQVGYASDGPKLAILLAPSDSVRLVGPDGTVAWRGVPSAPMSWDEAEDTGRIVDFSAFRTPGTWRLQAGSDTSWPIVLSSTPWEGLLKGLVKGLWYNRCSYAIQGPEAGAWTRAAGHPDTAVHVHASAVGPLRTIASRVRSPGGWYDAGDYGKYLPSSAISTWSLLHLYRGATGFLDTLAIGVPAHPEFRSDLLDEAVWNLRWMLSMQDPDDGGVYHRLTTPDFPGDRTMPSADRTARYLSPKSTAAALGLAATAAKAARILRTQSPVLADSSLQAALSAWNWARLHPTVYFKADSIKANFAPPLSAGPYDDQDVSDEFDWAASELMLTTGQDSFAVATGLSKRILVGRSATMIDWGDVRSLAVLSLSLEAGAIPPSASSLGKAADSMLSRAARSIRNVRVENGYRLPAITWKWSSNTVAANNGFVCWNAWRITRDTSFRSAAVDLLDYLLGRNATGYSFVTGFGALTPQHPHHRISNGDGVAAPVPGMLVGGPNPGQEDQCAGYPSTLAPKSFVDAACSYASNEPAINQNAALILLAGALSADPAGSGSSSIRHGTSVATLSTSLRNGLLQVRAPVAGSLEVDVFSLDGRRVAHATGRNGLAELSLTRRGFWIVRARTGGQSWQARVAAP